MYSIHAGIVIDPESYNDGVLNHDCLWTMTRIVRNPTFEGQNDENDVNDTID